MALSSPHLSICLLISIIYAFTNSQTIYSLNPLIQQVCAETAYPPFCEGFLSEHHLSAHVTDKHVLGIIAMERIIFDTRAAFIDITYDYLLSPQTTPEMREKLQQCSDQYDSIVRDTDLAYSYWMHNVRNAIDLAKCFAVGNKRAVHACRRAVGADYPPLDRFSMENERYQEILLTICDFNPDHQTSKMFKMCNNNNEVMKWRVHDVLDG